MKTIECEQGSSSWFNARLGVVTASEADSLITPLGNVRTGAGVETYMHRKLAEKILNWSPEQISGYAPDQGKLIESICIPWLEFEWSEKLTRAGFCTTDDGRAGFSPDAFRKDGSGIEIKSPQPPNQIKYLLEGKVPDDYIAQIQFSLMVCESAPYWTFVSYSMTLPKLIIRVERDEKIQAALREATSQFNERFSAHLTRLQELKENI